MPQFVYTAKTLQGETKSGSLEAKDIHQLARILRQDGSILIRAEISGQAQKRRGEINLSFFGPSLAEKMFFTRNLQVMISAGLPLPRALETLASQAKNTKFKKAILSIREEVLRGKSFSDSLIRFPDIFSSLFQNMVKVGEESGTLEDVLKTLTVQLERENDLKSKIKGAMIYPAVIISAMIGIGVIMLVTVVPKLNETFKELNVQLPLTTRLVIDFADFLTQKWYWAVAIFILVIFLTRQILKSASGKRFFDRVFLRIPVLSSLVKNTNSAFTARTLSSLISAGVSLPKSLEITSGTLGNIYYRKALMEAQEKVKTGEKLSAVFGNYSQIFPQTLIQMISVGEETGETSGVLDKIASFYEEEVANVTKNMTSIIEPVLMIVIGAVVGFFAVSMVQPMYSMLGAVE
ncbi:MAG: type II secretion system F family protein [Candidatus Nealsonbacteria bacterium]|nr:type II secretion system F family protein [Candidatus Nealsonbacteria bacterium]